MKYAFVIGSNAFIVPSTAISYADHEYEKEFLKINSIYHDLPASEIEPVLDIDLDIKDLDGTPIFIMGNRTLVTAPYTIKKERNSIWVLRADGSLIIQVHQLDDITALGLEHNIAAELEVNAPIAVIRVTGEFMVGSLHIIAENEKLYINNIGYATSALVGKNKLTFTANGVVL